MRTLLTEHVCRISMRRPLDFADEVVFPAFIHKPLTRVHTYGLMSVNITFLPLNRTFCFLFSGFLHFPLKRVQKNVHV